ncbi:MAG TPA: DNA-processing protein DprA, partial [Dehalococcoidia bacterium]|nr:DNA-processing protein DprA [Dehalococcoidia bacterium]
MEAHFEDLGKAWAASLGELKAAGIEDAPIKAILAARESFSPDSEMEKLRRASVKAVTWSDAEYPWRLKEIPDPPPVLYIKGSILPEDERAVAVVGTRGPTTYGRETASVLTGDLSKNGITIVSGLARGIDGISHRAAIENGGR